MRDPELVSSFNAAAFCSGQSSARLAILYESDLLVSYFSAIPLGDYWIDLHKDSSSTHLFHSNLYESNSTWSASYWEGSSAANHLCAIYSVQGRKFKDEMCSSQKSAMCEIVLE
jgi:hypothetical protein